MLNAIKLSIEKKHTKYKYEVRKADRWSTEIYVGENKIGSEPCTGQS
jgi:hypothetical protein